MARYAKFTIACGRRLTGKTGKTLRQLYKAVDSGRRVIIYDCTDEFGHYVFKEGNRAENIPDEIHTIKPIFIKDVPRFRVQKRAEMVRIRPFLDNGVRMGWKDLQDNLGYVLANFKDGILLIEDINKFTSDNQKNDLIGSLATLRQSGVDVITHFQLVGKVANQKMLGMANYIRLHKTNDSVENYRDGFADKLDMMMLAESIVDARYFHGMRNKIFNETGTYFNVTVDLENNRLHGIFNKGEAEAAIQKYMNTNPRLSIERMLNEKDRRGNKIWSSYEQAYSHMEQRLMDDYFVFKK